MQHDQRIDRLRQGVLFAVVVGLFRLRRRGMVLPTLSDLDTSVSTFAGAAAGVGSNGATPFGRPGRIAATCAAGGPRSRSSGRIGCAETGSARLSRFGRLVPGGHGLDGWLEPAMSRTPRVLPRLDSNQQPAG